MAAIRDYTAQFLRNWNINTEQIMPEIVEQYYNIYLDESSGGKVYGKSSEDLLEKIAPLVLSLNPKTILDYGCGRSSLIHYFWNDGKRKLYKYDPAIREYRRNPVEEADLILCTDVLEHIPEINLGGMIKHLKRMSDNVIFTISLIKARKKLPNGMNAHITIRPYEFWTELIKMYFPLIDVIELNENGIFLKTWK